MASITFATGTVIPSTWLNDVNSVVYNGIFQATTLTINGITLGRGNGNVATNTAVGASALAANSSGIQNTGVGASALQYQTSNNNTALGYNALLGVSGSSNGGSNTAVGSNSLAGLTGGNFNTAVGQQSLVSNTTASYNTAVGYQAGYSNVAGTNLVAVGYQAGYSNVTGAELTLIGYQAGRNTTSGNNTFVGMQAAYTNTTGTGSTAIGRYANYFNTTGSYNTSLGESALQANTTASRNTAAGYQAGYTNSTGQYNTFVGYSAGRVELQSGNTMIGDTAGYNTQSTSGYNTFIGQGAGNVITSGSKNTIIGHYDGNQGGLDIRTASNYIVLSDGDGNPQHSSYNGGTTALQGATPKAGTGITFPATQSASSDANTLDDYEEGTWTPVITGSGTAGTYTPSSVYANYTKVGNMVTIWGQMSFSAASGGTGYMIIGGLPFNYAANPSCAGDVIVSNFNFGTTAQSLVLSNTSSGSNNMAYIALVVNNAASGTAPISGVTTSTYIQFSMSYRV